MLKFTKKDNNKQFISIAIKDGTETKKVYNYIRTIFKNIDTGLYAMDSDEILLTLGILEYDFSLKELRESIAAIAKADVTHFCVDLELKNQRFNGKNTAEKSKSNKGEVKTMKRTKVDLKPTISQNERLMLASTTVMNATKIGTKTLAWVPVCLLNIQPYQRERQMHINKIAENWDDSKCNVLLVSYDAQQGWFNVMDGQHRAVAAKMRGIEYLVCEIFTGLNVSTEAALFVDANVNSKKLNPYDTYNANLFISPEDDTPLSILDKRIAAVCNKYGVQVRKSQACGTLKTIPHARAIMKSEGEECLAFIFEVVQGSCWDKFSNGYCYLVMEALRKCYKANTNNLDYVKKRLCGYMIKTSPKEVDSICNGKFPNLGRIARWDAVIAEIVA